MLKVAILGLGRVAGHHIEAINRTNGAELVAVCDRNSERLEAHDSLQTMPKYKSLDEMLSRGPEVDVVSICTPSGSHGFFANHIISKYKKNVVIEKPVVLNMADGDQIGALAQKHNVHVFPVHQYRFNKCVQRVLQAVQTQELGELFMATVRLRWCRPQSYYARDDWRGVYSMDGGCLTNQGIHHLDMLRYLVGDIKKVFAVTKTVNVDIEAEDLVVALVEFCNGVQGVIEVTTALRPDDIESSVSLLGKKGMAVISGWATDKLTTFTPNPEECNLCSDDFDTAYGFGHTEIYRDVVKTITSKTPPRITLDDAMRTVEVVHAIYSSAEQGEWLAVGRSAVYPVLGKYNDRMKKYFAL